MDLITDDLEQMLKHKTRGEILRCKLKWIEEGEKPSKFFCGLEKSNGENKLIKYLKDHNIDITGE